MSYLNLASLRLCTESEGPGKRLALWVQGCMKRCPGCCNPEMQEIRRNTIIETEDLVVLIKKSIKQNEIEGISLIGGEPFLQAEGLSEIAEWSKLNGLTVLAFTGYLLEELHEMNNKYIERLLKSIDLLVDGPFIQEQYDTERDWVGSKNQRVLFLSDVYKPGVELIKKEHQMEVMVSENDILVNGWPYT